MNEEIDIVSSFLAGFGERDDSDVINGLFIAFKKLRVKPPFDFESRGCSGVESKGIRKILYFGRLLKNNGNHKEFFNAGRFLSNLSSNEIAWAAQYLMGKKTHLYPFEAQRAKEILDQFKI
ncbi:MAG: hypothetical protein NZ903_02945 [Candidatus Micrarchaeota archaeon]|nr:hypothetical protein [Candidatus Micrarchaeota archaeon]